MAWVRARLCELQKGCTRLAVASDNVYHLLAHGRWLLPPLKLVARDIAEILLKVALNTKNQIKSSYNSNYKLVANIYYYCNI
jgi:hypothetical protein